MPSAPDSESFQPPVDPSSVPPTTLGCTSIDEARVGPGRSADDGGDLTLLIQRMQSGEPGAADQLASAVYDDLLAMARGHLGRDVGPQLAGVTIQPTMLANDTLMKLIRQRQQFDNTGHFFAIASRLMMRVLLDYHRTRNAEKRGRAKLHVPLDPKHDDVQHDGRLGSAGDDDDVDVEAFSAALDRLAELDARKADVVRYRILWGLTLAEISQTLNVAVSTVDRDWTFARAWLTKELQKTTN